MSERIQRQNEREINKDFYEVRIQYGDYEGVAQLVDNNEQGGYRWQISILARDTRQLICYWDGAEIDGDGSIAVSLDDIKRAQDDIAEAIQSLAWEPYK
ncbi:hypothetical protein KC953_02170 [Candidatus Saccharibacteria bacterium]|nr:hypothetical protein [Candidatus Saccharibacteria bacterium]USN97035.1 MAG: hypothetical protein H6797_02480 [Candidatus Nomurabacteria bacterium]